ncbi:zinc-dependent metalloprotease [Citricoccus sp. GCM10030269]|uniref:zinc-dependent metalloprotease n=1 Tax=Citricoccus sp. GCM10030269 TaxID=3273388 RepID=UPI0036221D02
MEPSPTSPVNWDLAASTAARLCAAGPRFTRHQAEREADGLRRAADESVDHVHRITQLDAARDLRDSEVLVVDRPTWTQANVQAFSTLLGPAFDYVQSIRPEEYAKATSGLGTVATAVEAGAVLAFLSSKVLGQYEPFCALPGPDGTSPGPEGGRLLLVAPNIAEVRVELNVDPEDFRLWVCLHEQTHRVQFAAAPWLREHLQSTIMALVSGMFDKVDTLPERLSARFRALIQGPAADPKSVEQGEGSAELGTDEHPASMGLLELIQDPEDKKRLSQLNAVMSLLEGHANVVMDAVDASVVPTVKTIRQRFDHRTSHRSSLDRWIRRFMGMDAKMRQYRDGQRFVKRVVREIGMDGFNVVWESADHLPSEHELHHPEEWIARVRSTD